MSTQCRYCGEAVRPDSMFCPSCGQLIGAVPPFPGKAAPVSPATAAPAPAQPAPELPPVPLPALRPGAPDASGAVAPEAQPAAPVPGHGAPAAAQKQTAHKQAAHKPATRKQAQPEPAPAGPPTGLTLPGGQRLELDRVLVFGRSPEQGASSYQGVPVRLEDPERAMSRVHLVVSPTPDGPAATDPGSANGTLLERGGMQYALVAGTPTLLVRGDRLLLGDVALAVG